jgi:hypothetical protein
MTQDGGHVAGGSQGGVGIEELGRITCTYKLEIESLEDQIYEDNRQLEKCYFDPFVKEPTMISKVCFLLPITDSIELKNG